MRMNEIYDPYHNRLAAMIDEMLARGDTPVIFSIHSFTPVFFKERRQCEVGVMWLQDRRIAGPMMDFFAAKGFRIGDNEPYDAKMIAGATINRHADDLKLPNALIEIRHDLIDTPEKAFEWANLLKTFMNQILADDSIHTLYDGPVFAYDLEASTSYFDHLNNKARQAEDI
jgi:predicted N-formylglutamate amidohydrolase